eukprot:7042080-Alexandrium_andersonii.AAC.1
MCIRDRIELAFCSPCRVTARLSRRWTQVKQIAQPHYACSAECTCDPSASVARTMCENAARPSGTMSTAPR